MRAWRCTSARATTSRIGRSSDGAAADGTLIPLDGLIGQFPTTADRFRQGYAESVSAVDYIVRTYRTGRPRRAHPLVRRRPHRRRGVQGGARRRHDRLRRRLAGRRQGQAADPLRPAAGAVRSGPGGVGRVGRRRPGPSAAPGGAAQAPAPSAAASAAPGAGTDAAPDVPAWMAPLVAVVGVIVVVVLVLAARRNRAPDAAAVTSAAQRLRAIPSWQVTLGVALLALGFLIAAQLASEGPRVRYTTQERTPLVETATGLQAAAGRAQDPDPPISRPDPGHRERRARAPPTSSSSSTRSSSRRASPPGSSRSPGAGSSSSSRIRRSRSRPAAASRTTSSARATSGPSSRSCGAPVPRPSRSTASGSRRPRRSSTSARSLLVNSAYLAPPYQITRPRAGRPLRPARAPRRASSTSSGPGATAYGIRVSIAEPQSVDIPAFVGTVTLRYSRPLASPSAGPSATPSSVPGG